MDTGLNESQKDQELLVAEWLLSTPGFFERHPELLAQIELAHSHSGKAISLQEKQMALLRSQNRDLNQRLSEMLRFGTENDRTQSLMIQWLEGLLVTNILVILSLQFFNDSVIYYFCYYIIHSFLFFFRGNFYIFFKLSDFS